MQPQHSKQYSNKKTPRCNKNSVNKTNQEKKKEEQKKRQKNRKLNHSMMVVNLTTLIKCKQYKHLIRNQKFSNWMEKKKTHYMMPKKTDLKGKTYINSK